MASSSSENAITTPNRNDRGNQQGQSAPSQGAQVSTNVERKRQENRIARRGLSPFMSPFALLQRILTDDLAGMFTEPGIRSLSTAGAGAGTADDVMTWAPKVDVVQRGNELVVRADLPGLKPDDVTVDVTDDSIVLSGRRQQEQVEENGSVYRYERAFGSFFREIPLPEGSLVDQATATFKDGVLEITVPAPPEQVSRGRRLEINSEGSRSS
jgi:HSP20 family protein